MEQIMGNIMLGGGRDRLVVGFTNTYTIGA
jgi:hypothetical protein